MRFAKRSSQLKRLQRELRNFDELSRSSVNREDSRDYETVNQAKDDEPPSSTAQFESEEVVYDSEPRDTGTFI